MKTRAQEPAFQEPLGTQQRWTGEVDAIESQAASTDWKAAVSAGVMAETSEEVRDPRSSYSVSSEVSGVEGDSNLGEGDDGWGESDGDS